MNNLKKGKKNITLRVVGSILIVIGILIIAYPSYTNFIMKRREADILNSWENQIISGTTAQTGTTQTTASGSTQVTDESGNIAVSQSSDTQSGEKTSPVATTKKPLFKITIPKINSAWIVYEGTDIATLKSGPGHYIGTAMPGEIGACVIAGHRTTYGAPFNRVDQLINGDMIILETIDNKQFTYLVTGKIEVAPNDISAIKPTEYPSLILSTCTPKYYALRRLLIFAKLAE